MEAKKIVIVKSENATKEFKCWFDKLENKYEYEGLLGFSVDNNEVYKKYKSLLIAGTEFESDKPVSVEDVVKMEADPDCYTG